MSHLGVHISYDCIRFCDAARQVVQVVLNIFHCAIFEVDLNEHGLLL